MAATSSFVLFSRHLDRFLTWTFNALRFVFVSFLGRYTVNCTFIFCNRFFYLSGKQTNQMHVVTCRVLLLARSDRFLHSSSLLSLSRDESSTKLFHAKIDQGLIIFSVLWVSSLNRQMVIYRGSIMSDALYLSVFCGLQRTILVSVMFSSLLIGTLETDTRQLTCLKSPLTIRSDLNSSLSFVGFTTSAIGTTSNWPDWCI